MPNITITTDDDIDHVVEIEIYCGGCNQGICGNATPGKTKKRSKPYFEITPCQRCLDEAKKEGDEEGYSRAEQELKSSD